MKRCKIIECLVLTIVLVFSLSDLAMASQNSVAVTGSGITIKTEEELAQELIEKMIAIENEQEWDAFPELWCSAEKEDFIELFTSDYFLRDNLGVSTVRSAELISINEVSVDEIPGVIKSGREYEWCTEWKAFLVAVDYQVAEVNGYFYNGVNYSIVAVGKEDGEWKIIARTMPSLELLNSLPIVLDAEGNNSVAVALEIRHAREHGLLLDSNMEIVDNLAKERDAVDLYNACKKRRAGHTCAHVEYATIRVKGYETPIDFDEYIKVNLFSELHVSYKADQAFMAHMIAAKQVAMYTAYYQSLYVSQGYDITSNEQAYLPSKWDERYGDYVDELYDAIKHLHIETEDNKTFFPHYALTQEDLEDIGEPGMIQEEIVELNIPFDKILKKYYNRITTDHIYTGDIQLVAYAGYRGWKEVNDIWYYYNSQTHYPFMDWKEINGLWYYFQADEFGAMKTGWLRDGGEWYYLATADDNSTEGAMFASRWLLENGDWYYFKADGAMAASETLYIDGVYYMFDSSGVWIE